IFERPHKRFEHEVELTWLGEFAAALWTFFGSQNRGVELIRTETGLTLLTIHQRIHKTGDVARRLPNPGMHQDRSVNPLDILPIRHPPPPALLHMALELDPERPNTQTRFNPAIDLARRKNKTSALTERNKVCHILEILRRAGWLGRGVARYGFAAFSHASNGL